MSAIERCKGCPCYIYYKESRYAPEDHECMNDFHCLEEDHEEKTYDADLSECVTV